MAATLGAMVAQQAMQTVKDNKLISRGLNALGRRAKNRLLRRALTGAGKIASNLGFDAAIGTTQTNQSTSRRNPKRRRGGRRRAKTAGVVSVSGATTVGAGNAPVAFARTLDLKPFFGAYPVANGDGMMVHVVEAVGQVNWAGAGNTFGVPFFSKLGPQNSGLFPWLSTFAPLFARYKLKFLRLHYQHFTGTSTPGQVMLQYFPDPSWNDSVATGLTYTIVTQAGNFMTGAAYEDFFHTADLSAVDPDAWLDTQSTTPSDDVNPNYAGLVGVYTLNGAPAQPNTGNFWIEAVFEFNGRSSSSVTVGISQINAVIRSKIDRERKQRLAFALVTQVLDDLEAVEKRKKAAPVDEFIVSLEKKLPVPARPSDEETAPTRRPYAELGRLPPLRVQA